MGFKISGEGFGGGFQNATGLNWAAGLPGGSYFLETPEDIAGRERLNQMQQMAIEFDEARMGQSMGRQQAIQNMAGALSPLNEFVRGGTGFGIDMNAITAPVTGPGSPQWNDAIARREAGEAAQAAGRADAMDSVFDGGAMSAFGFDRENAPADPVLDRIREQAAGWPSSPPPTPPRQLRGHPEQPSTTPRPGPGDK